MISINYKNRNFLRSILTEIGYDNNIKLNVIYLSRDQKYITFNLTFESSIVLFDDISYGKVKTSQGFSNKIMEYVENKKYMGQSFFIPEFHLDKITESFYFNPDEEVQKKLLTYYLKKIKTEEVLDNYTFLLSMPGIFVKSFDCSKVIHFYKVYKEKINDLGISLIHLNSNLIDPNLSQESLVSFFNSSSFNISNISRLSNIETQSEKNQILKYLIKDFVDVVENKLSKSSLIDNSKESNFKNWLSTSRDILSIFTKVFNKKIFEIYREDSDFAKKFESLRSSCFSNQLISPESNIIIKNLNLLPIKTQNFFKKRDKHLVDYILINNGSFFENIPPALIDYFTNQNSFLELFKSSIENSSNATVKDVLMSNNVSFLPEKDMVMILVSDSSIDKEEIEKIIIKTLNQAVKCSSVEEIKSKVKDIAILVFQDLLEEKAVLNNLPLNSKINKPIKF